MKRKLRVQGGKTRINSRKEQRELLRLKKWIEGGERNGKKEI